MKRVLFVSSSGGHFTELLKLENMFNKYEYLLVTEETNNTLNLKSKYNIKFLKYGSRQYKIKYAFVLIYNVFKSLSLILKFKPDVIITTGAHTGGIMALVGKILNKKIIYIESLAKVNSLSMTGNFVYKFADKFYVQWEELTKKYEKAEYIGRLM